jgi:DNA (cytosine-5)-methyltransferase 1
MRKSLLHQSPRIAIEMFAGIGGFRLGMASAGINVIWANDIDALACKVYEHNFGPGSIICDDIRNVENSIPRHDLLTAGFPCQPFSQAGKKLGTADTDRGNLFEVIARVLRTRQPRFFVLENVKRLLSMDGGDHFRSILCELSEAGYFIEWRLLNAKNFGLAQNRERVIFVGSLSSPTGTFFEMLEAKAVMLTQDDLDGLKFYDEDNFIDCFTNLKSFDGRFTNWGMAYRGKVLCRDLRGMLPQSPVAFLRDILEPSPDSSFDLTDRTIGWLHKNDEVNCFINGVEILSNQEGGRRMGYTIFGINGIAPTVTATTSRHYERYFIDKRYRRLTNVEYARLQGFEDDWCTAASRYDQYALYGNAVPPPLISWAVSRLAGNNVNAAEIRTETLFPM